MSKITQEQIDEIWKYNQALPTGNEYYKYTENGIRRLILDTWQKAQDEILGNIRQMIIDEEQICNNCLATQGECERHLLDKKDRCCSECWHSLINCVNIEEKIERLRKLENRKEKME